jgi:hypothetical protein
MRQYEVKPSITHVEYANIWCEWVLRVPSTALQRTIFNALPGGVWFHSHRAVLGDRGDYLWESPLTPWALSEPRNTARADIYDGRARVTFRFPLVSDLLSSVSRTAVERLMTHGFETAYHVHDTDEDWISCTLTAPLDS